MKIILKLLVSLILFTVIVSGQQTETVNRTDPGNRYFSSVKQITTYDYKSDIDILYLEFPPSTDDPSMTRCGYSIDDRGDHEYQYYEMGWVEYILPRGLQCSQATLTVKLLNASPATQTCEYAFYVIRLENSIVDLNMEERWNEANNAQILGSKNNCQILTLNVKDLVNNAASSGKILFGIKATNPEYPIEAVDYMNLHYEGTVTKVGITVKNDMNGYDGGQINFGLNSPATQMQSPIDNNNIYNVNDILNVGAIENQSYGGYNWIWNAPEETQTPNNKSEWKREKGTSSTFINYPQSTTYKATSNDDGANVIGYLRKVCNLTFSNSFNGISTTGSIKVNGATVSAPTVQYSVVEGNTIQVEAIPQTYSDVKYTFSHWSDGNTQNPRTITANSHGNFTAVYVGTPIFTNFGINNRDLHFNTYNPRIQQFVTLYWNEHVSSNVISYKIYRSDKSQGETYFVYIGAVSRGTTSYEDADYYLTSSTGGTELKYDVRAYYIPDQTVSDGGYVSTHGTSAQVNKAIVGDSILIEMPAIKDFALNSNYPNPFNPTTQISYEIPENSFVNLVVYNSIGQKVVELVNQHQTMGKYSVQFNASNPDGLGRGLTSGVYIYKLQAGAFSEVKKMLLMK